jgi:hypothetical protein
MEDSRRHSLDEAAAESRAAAAAAATASNRGVNADSDGVVESAGSAGAGGGGGSCQCSCPPGRGFGFCFEMPSGTAPNDEACNIVDTTAPKFCPGVGVPKQCHDPPLESDLDCPAVGEHMHGDVGNALVWGGILNCTLRSNCTAPGGDSRFGAASCDCAAWRFGKHGCAWCVALCCAVLCCAVLCCAVLCCAAVRCDAMRLETGLAHLPLAILTCPLCSALLLQVEGRLPGAAVNILPYFAAEQVVPTTELRPEICLIDDVIWRTLALTLTCTTGDGD